MSYIRYFFSIKATDIAVASGPTTPTNAYVAENGTTNYVAENGSTFLVQES